MKYANFSLLCVSLAALLAGCGSDETRTVVKTVTAEAGAGKSSPAVEATSTAPAETESQAPEIPRHLTQFQTPSGNIGCYMGGGSVRCDIAERSWSPPPKPSSCDVDWGQGVQVGKRRGAFVCAGDTALDRTAPVLAYGQLSKRGRIACVSQTAGIRCADAKTRHGFFLSRERYSLF